MDLRADRGRVAGLAVEVQGQLLRGQPLGVEDEKSEQLHAPCGQRQRAPVEARGRVAARQTFTEVARGTADDVERALDAAHGAAPAWGKTSVAARADILNKIADRIEANLEKLAVADSWDNGKPIRETLAADLPLIVDHWRYFAGAIRAQEGGLSELDTDTVAYHFHEPIGVVGQIIPWNFPLL
ncbi:MAG TPA: aldehyde dehydrogenase family protein, partial [Pseudonocardiaceae bacterium]